MTRREFSDHSYDAKQCGRRLATIDEQLKPLLAEQRKLVLELHRHTSALEPYLEEHAADGKIIKSNDWLYWIDESGVNSQPVIELYSLPEGTPTVSLTEEETTELAFQQALRDSRLEDEEELDDYDDDETPIRPTLLIDATAELLARHVAGIQMP